jgi:hypothetical protein
MIEKGFTMTDKPAGPSRRSVNALRLTDEDPQMLLHPDAPTEYQWLESDGTPLLHYVVRPGAVIRVVLDDLDPPYDMLVRDGNDWVLIYQIRRGPNDTTEVIRPAGWTA